MVYVFENIDDSGEKTKTNPNLNIPVVFSKCKTEMSLPIHKYIYNNNSFLKILRGQDKHLKYNIIQQNLKRPCLKHFMTK